MQQSQPEEAVDTLLLVNEGAEASAGLVRQLSRPSDMEEELKQAKKRIGVIGLRCFVLGMCWSKKSCVRAQVLISLLTRVRQAPRHRVC